MTSATDTFLLVPALLSAADEHATGALSTSLPDGDPAQVYVDEGRVYGVVARDGSRTLGERLVASGALSCEDLEFALDAQRNDVPCWRIGELLVHLGFVGPDQVQACLAEQMQEMVGWLLAQPPSYWHLRRGSRTRAAFAPPIDVVELLGVLGVQLAPPPGPAAEPSAESAPAPSQPSSPQDLAAGALLTMDRRDAMAALHALNGSEDEAESIQDSRRRGLSLWRSSETQSQAGTDKRKDKRARLGRRTR